MEKEKAYRGDPRRAKDRNRAIRQEALREQLAAKGLVQHVIETAQKLANESLELDPVMVQRLKASAELRLKLVNKYLPDLKAVEVTGADGEPLVPSIDVSGLSDVALAELLAARERMNGSGVTTH